MLSAGLSGTVTLTFALDTPIGDYQINVLSQVYRPNETPTTLLTDTIICKITAAEVNIVQEEEEEEAAQQEETFLDSFLEPYLEPEPASSYSFEIGTDDDISIELGQIIDP